MTAIITIETRTAAEIADDLSEILQGDLARLEAVPSLLQAIAAQLPALYQMRDMERAGSEAIDMLMRAEASTGGSTCPAGVGGPRPCRP